MATFDTGSILSLDIEKPVAGGRMLARHEGRVVLVGGAIPGERVLARVERIAKGVVYGEAIDVLSPSPDRRESVDWRCGGNALGHVNYSRQLRLKQEIISDTFGRIGRVKLPEAPDMAGSPEHGYRMRARLHAQSGRIGFYREGTHELCEPGATGQLLSETCSWLSGVEQTLGRHQLEGLIGIELAENISGSERAAHLDLHVGADLSRFTALADGLVGLSAGSADRPDVIRLAGAPIITDVLNAREGDSTTALRFRRDVRGFFQGNRFLLERLVHQVITLVPDGPVVDLYAGVGLFGLSLAAAGADAVTLVEGDPICGSDLLGNARDFGHHVRVERQSVEVFLQSAAHKSRGRPGNQTTFIVDPPRTGLSRDALQGVVRIGPRRVIYVSCDVPTLARDTRMLLDSGYELARLAGMDLFPNTAHVESIALFVTTADTPRQNPRTAI